jgi:uncharacterized protein with LGFP repeats
MPQIVKVVTTALAAVITVACGQSAIHVSPAVADAKNFTGGVVSFTANGLSNPTWCIGTVQGFCNGFITGIPATIDSSGHAQCIQGESGRVTVIAGRGTHVVIPDTGEQLSPFGTAQLTCP